MPTLKEIKGRISSVKNTLKITSAMKLVSSAKLRKAQNAVAAMRPYEAQLQRMLAVVSGGAAAAPAPGAKPAPHAAEATAIVAIASNSSLCGSFNANVLAKVRSVRKEGDVVYSIGRKMADAMRKDGFPSPEDFTSLAEHPAYSPAAGLVSRLMEELEAGRIGKVLLVYNHYVSTARQVPVTEQLLPLEEAEDPSPVQDDKMAGRADEREEAPDVILEPEAAELFAQLLPKTLKLKLYAALLDSAAAEHAARTVAMQTATDNGDKLLGELTLQYNKGRQQKITSEILDLAGGQAAEQ
jgi:F-type H+-transporting ATPase subunit gamma